MWPLPPDKAGDFLVGFVDGSSCGCEVLSFTMGMLHLSQNARAAGLRLAFWRIGSAMMSQSTARIEVPWASCVSTWSIGQACHIA